MRATLRGTSVQRASARAFLLRLVGISLHGLDPHNFQETRLYRYCGPYQFFITFRSKKPHGPQVVKFGNVFHQQCQHKTVHKNKQPERSSGRDVNWGSCWTGNIRIPMQSLRAMVMTCIVLTVAERYELKKNGFVCILATTELKSDDVADGGGLVVHGSDGAAVGCKR